MFLPFQTLGPHSHARAVCVTWVLEQYQSCDQKGKHDFALGHLLAAGFRPSYLPQPSLAPFWHANAEHQQHVWKILKASKCFYRVINPNQPPWKNLAAASSSSSRSSASSGLCRPEPPATYRCASTQTASSSHCAACPPLGYRVS